MKKERRYVVVKMTGTAYMNKMRKIIYPNKLNENMLIGVTAMSSGLGDDRGVIKFKNAKENFTNKGFKIVETGNVLTYAKLVSSDSKIRVQEFLSLLNNDEISYILIACGGEFLMETLPLLHENRTIIENLKYKWIQGYSDVSLLNFYLTTNYYFATIHANSFSSYAMIPWDKSLNVPIDFVTNPKDFTQESFEFYEKVRDRSIGSETNPYNLTERVEYKSLNNNSSESFSGRIIGGCMDVLKVLIGTKYDNTSSFCDSFEEGVIWYLENCEMSVTDIKRTLWQMNEAGWFNNVKGFIIGRTNSAMDIADFSYEDALKDTIGNLNIPIVYDVDFGHVAPQWTIINGSFAEFNFDNGKGSLKQRLI